MTVGCVLDSSALLAPLLQERGAEVVLKVLSGAAPVLLSTVNLVEAISRLHHRRGLPATEARDGILSLGLAVVPFYADQAEIAGALHARVRDRGISLGDCACLALGQSRGFAVLTADSAWAVPDLGVEVRFVR